MKNIKYSIYMGFLVMFSPHLLMSQNKINHIVYGIKLNENKDNRQSDYDMLITNLNAKLKQVIFNLEFNDSISKFSFNNNALSFEDNNSILDIADMIGNEYYRKAKSDTLIVKKLKFVNDGNSVVFSIIKTDWFITNERKVINGYECIKAYAKLKKDYGDGEENELYDLIAWFCPEISNSFGPKNYGNLPGMILELEQSLIIFRALGVSHNNIENDIYLPKEKIIPEFKIHERK